MRRLLKWGLIALGVLLALPLLAVVTVLAVVNTGPGERLIERQAASLTGGTVALSGVGGIWPAAPRIGRIELRDADGVYAVVEDVALDWSPAALLSRTAQIDLLAARKATLARLPHSAPNQSGSGKGGGFTSPVQVKLAKLRIDRVEIAARVAGTALAVGVDGTARFASLDDLDADLALHDLGGAGTYHLRAGLLPGHVDVSVKGAEPPHGLLARLAALPDLGTLGLDAAIAGPRGAAATTLTLSAGPLRAGVQGTVDLDSTAADLTATAQAPAMSPVSGVAFQVLDLTAHIKGKLAAPEASGHLVLDGLAAGGAGVRRLTADLSGNTGTLSVTAAAEGLRLPGPRPDLLEADPVTLSASVGLAGTRPFSLSVHHSLLAVDGTGQLAAPMSVKAHLTAGDLAPFAAIGGVALQGRAALDVAATLAEHTDVTLDGTLGLTAGPGPSAALIGPDARIGISASIAESDVTLSRLMLDGAALHLAATGHSAATGLVADATVTFPTLRAAAATLAGHATLHATAGGTPEDIAAKLDLDGDVATPGVPSGHVAAHVSATGLPGNPAGEVTAQGQLDGAPLSLAAAVRRDGGSTNVTITKADWRSAHAEGALTLAAGATLPTGHLALRMTRLDELRRLAGAAISGSVEATIDLADKLATAQVRALRAGVPGTSVGRAVLDAKVADPLGEARVDATLAADGVRSGAVAARARVAVNGPRTALAIRAQVDATGVAGGPASVQTAAMVDADRRVVALASLSATARGETLRLLAPARLSLGDTIAVDRLRVGLRDAVLEVAGRVSPTLDLTASLRNVRADLARIADPSLQADGVLSADARLTGTPARPSGTVRLDAAGLHLRTGPASSLPAAAIAVRATLAGRSAQLDATASAAANRLTVTGTAPIDPAGPLDLHAVGGLDLALLDPILSAQGRRLRGKLAIDAGVSGTLAAPRSSGTVRLAGGEIQDFAQGLHIDQIEATIAAAGDTLHIERFNGRAGQGTLGATGSIGLAAPMPVDLHLTAARATPLASDLLTAQLGTDLHVRGTLAGRLDVAGTVTIDRASIQVPDRLPASVAVLDVRRPGQPPPPPPAPGPDIGLDVLLSAPGQIFIRGRGIDAELAGRLTLRGTARLPRPEGKFTLRRGDFTVAGKTLTFTSGEVGFDGSGKLDPTLNFVATNVTGGTTATLTVGGYASAPKITLSSSPELPQDEILAHLLFGQSAANLGPFQLASIAAALAQLSGATGGGFDPLDSARRGLGLDRLSVGGSGTAPGLEAGRYVARGVYLGAKQSTSGAGTQATLQVDITKGLKLETDVGTGGSSAQGSSGNSSGTSVGLTYQFEY